MSDSDVLIVDAAEGTPRGRFGATLAEVAEAPHRRPTDARIFEDARIALCMDARSLRAATEAGVPCRIAVLPTFDTRFDSLDDASAVFIAHDHLRRTLPRAVRDVAHTIGPMAPTGWSPPESREALRTENELPSPVVLVPASLVAEHGATQLLLQLSLVSGEPAFLFDVDLDVEAAEALRRLVPPHDLHAWLFARGDDALGHWQLADIVVAEPRMLETTLAISVGAGLALLPDVGGTEAAEALDKSGIASRSQSIETLAVTIDEALARREQAQQAAKDLDAGGAAERILTLARRVADRRQTLPRGLPHGLEPLPRGSRSETPPPTEPEESDEDLEARIEDELAELKKRL